MSWLPRKAVWRLVRRRFAAGVVLLSYLAVTIGQPMPALAHKNHPCENNPCGCQSAEECWTSCCCYTVEEHWAWARANHVEPPPYAVRPADDGWRQTPARDQEANEADCSCCTQKCTEPKSSKPQPRWVIGAAALRCKGANALGTSAAAVPPPSLVTWVPFLPFQCSFSSTDDFAAQRPSAPPDPPPRRFSC